MTSLLYADLFTYTILSVHFSIDSLSPVGYGNLLSLRLTSKLGSCECLRDHPGYRCIANAAHYSLSNSEVGFQIRLLNQLGKEL